MEYCRNCGLLPLECFYIRDLKWRRDRGCKECQRRKQREYYRKRKEGKVLNRVTTIEKKKKKKVGDAIEDSLESEQHKQAWNEFRVDHPECENFTHEGFDAVFAAYCNSGHDTEISEVTLKWKAPARDVTSITEEEVHALAQDAEHETEEKEFEEYYCMSWQRRRWIMWRSRGFYWFEKKALTSKVANVEVAKGDDGALGGAQM
jgi:hypothetical protein